MKFAERITEGGAQRQVVVAYTIWEAIAECVQRFAKEILGISRRGGSRMKGVWWWNEEVK